MPAWNYFATRNYAQVVVFPELKAPSFSYSNGGWQQRFRHHQGTAPIGDIRGHRSRQILAIKIGNPFPAGSDLEELGRS
jgi:predicted amidohydrolase